jgi:hypothetical protein
LAAAIDRSQPANHYDKRARRAAQPTHKVPNISITHVEGSGTAFAAATSIRVPSNVILENVKLSDSSTPGALSALLPVKLKPVSTMSLNEKE